jgi:hypothetical protein
MADKQTKFTSPTLQVIKKLKNLKVVSPKNVRYEADQIDTEREDQNDSLAHSPVNKTHV